MKRLFSFPVVIASMLCVLAVLSVRGRFNDPDMWWHLRMGQMIFNSHSIPTADSFSFTANHHLLVPHEWLAQLSIYSVYHFFGYSGLMLWLCAALSAIYIAGYILCGLYSGNWKVAFLGALVLFVFSTVGASVRPQLLGYLLLLFELLIIHLGRTRSVRWFWLMPLLFAIWINIHGSFFLGILLTAVYLAASFFDFRVGSITSQRWARATRGQFLAATLVSIAALFINPDGLRQVVFPIDLMLREPINLAGVQEWHPLQLTSERGVVLLLVLAAIFLLVALRRAEIRLEELLLLALGLWLAGGHDRMLFVFGILTAPVFVRLLANEWENYNPAADRLLPNVIMIMLAMATVWIGFPRPAALRSQIESGSPVAAVSYIQSHHLTGPMLNDYTFGGYLIWAMPEHPVFIDGRAEIYEWAGVLSQYMNWMNLNTDPEALLDQYHIQFCLLNANSYMVRVLTMTHHWKLVYSDRMSAILVRDPA
ncbi:hypothetical protein ACFPT7_15870 [Acidicapsa dinghuensis]|uniref:Glycosyltransferase RgtA/B/C/D-like domain-containing protein n=1 Tax=Acidicapsa dinghuensis TaxID=2218256 RepID=A0ABW1EHK3_9BACT|nr:hypothetical protein [Acidicapsa dinghuensis]